MARQPFELERKIEQTPHLRIALIFRRKLRHAVERAFERPRISRMIWHKLRQPINMAVAHLKDAASIFENRARLQSPKGNDLRDLTTAVFLLNVTDHFLTPCFAEIDVEIGHRHTFRIEEAFKQQPKPDRIKIGNRQRPRDNRACARTTPRPHRDVIVLGPFYKVRNNQEVAGETHVDDNVEFKFKPVVIDLFGDFLFAQNRHDLCEPRC